MTKFLKILSFIGTFLLMLIVMLYVSLLIICYGPSKSARNMFVTTFLETGAFKFVVGLVMPDSKVKEIVDSNSLKELEGEVDSKLIDTSKSKDKKDGTNYQLSYTYQDNILVSGKSNGTISVNLGDLVKTGGSSEELGDLGGLVGSLLGDAKMIIKSDSAVSGSKSCKLNYPDLKNFTRY